MSIIGKISSFQSLGAVDGPGVRFVVFLKGCPLNCACCHNPETRSFEGGEEFTAEQIVEKAERYKEYFKGGGGITLSGGEPLAQSEFAAEIFKLCKQKNIHTCLDTSGCILNDGVKNLLKYTDLCMLDVKFTNACDYQKYAGGELDKTLEFLSYLDNQNIKTWIRQVIIPGINNGKEDVLALKSTVSSYRCVEKIELLPFRKICETKYNQMKIPFRLKDTPEPNVDEMQNLKALIDAEI